MGDKFDNKSKKQKKPTKKEQKAQNHLKLMEGHKRDNQNIANAPQFHHDKDKKAA